MQLGFLRALRGIALDILLWGLCVSLLGANVVLLQQNRVLRGAASRAADASGIEAGRHLGRYLAAATMDSVLRPISFPPSDPRRTLAITFSPGCPHCRANLKNWLVVANELRQRKDWRILWLSRDPVEPTREYCESFEIPLSEAFADPTHRTYLVLGLSEVPNTIVADEKGIVQRVWRGELDGTEWRQILDYLGIPTALVPSQ